MRTIIGLIVAIGATITLAACDGEAGNGSGDSGNTLATAEVTVADGAWVDAHHDGGEELFGVTFSNPARAVCNTGDRIGVIPSSVDEAEVDNWTNATDEPVVFVFSEDVDGDTGDLPVCSVAYSEDEVKTELLHGRHTHADHS